MKRKAFTLVELLVVITVISLLMAILLPALRKARNQAQRAFCSNNVKQILMALHIYANEFNNRLPCPAIGDKRWMRPLDTKSIDYLMKYLKNRKVFYCPCNKQQIKYTDFYWNYKPTSRITGYMWVLDTLEGRSWKISGNGNKKWVRTIDVSNPGDVEILADIVMSNERDYGPPNYPHGNFFDVPGQLENSAGVLDSSSHLLSDSKCEGGNVGFADGHVEWRPFAQMERRSTYYFTYPTFWW